MAGKGPLGNWRAFFLSCLASTMVWRERMSVAHLCQGSRCDMDSDWRTDTVALL